MRVQVQGKDYEIPSPVYILPETVVVEDQVVSGKCRFPSSDPSIGERGDHANIIHGLAVVWNASNVWAQRHNVKRLFAQQTSQTALGVMPPDKDIDFVIRLTSSERVNRRLSGSIVAEFARDGRPVLVVKVEKFVERRN